MQLSFTYQLEGQEPASVTLRPAALIAWERATGKQLAQLQEYGYTGLTEIAYHGLRARGQIPQDHDGAMLDLDAWVDRLDLLDFGNPTNQRQENAP